MNYHDIKKKANQALTGNLWNFWKAYLVIFLCSFVLTAFVTAAVSSSSVLGSILSLAITLLLTPLYTGLLCYWLKMIRKEEVLLSDIWKFMGKLWPVIMLNIIITVLTFLWSLLFIIPGIIAAISYSMAVYIFVDGEEDPMECISKSKELMRGYKFDYFLFCLSFIGWMFVGALTLGILLIYVVPYYSLSITVYYDELKKKKALS